MKRKPTERPSPGGLVYYREAGLTKPVLVHLSAPVHGRLKRLALRKEESLQTILRKLIEGGLKRAEARA